MGNKSKRNIAPLGEGGWFSEWGVSRRLTGVCSKMVCVRRWRTKKEILSWLYGLLSNNGRFVFCVDAIGFADGKPLFEVARGDTPSLM
jgi:hypothetical protein